MKTGRTRTLLIVLTLIVILAGCGKDNSQATEVPADLVSEIAGEMVRQIRMRCIILWTLPVMVHRS